MICALFILSSCGVSAKLSESTPSEPLSTVAVAAPVTDPVDTTLETVTTTATKPTTATAECSNGNQQTRNATSDSYDRYSCVRGKWTFKETVKVPTTTIAARGTRDNPFSPTALTYGDWSDISILPVEMVDAALIHSANQFNDDAGPGQSYARIQVSGIYAGTEKGTSSDFRYGFGLAGDKGKVYDAASVSDSHNLLSEISDSPDVLAGGALTGFIYYLVDVDDTNFLVVTTGSDGLQFIDVSP